MKKQDAMKNNLKKNLLASSRRATLLCLASASLLLPSAAQAKGTLADTIVEMSFSLDYALSGVEQNPITNTDDPLIFVVDRFESVTVSSMGDADVVPNAEDQELLFSVSNTGNDIQDYTLSIASILGSDFEVENLEIYFLQDDGDGVYTETENGRDFELYDKNRTQLSSEADGVIWISVRGDMPTETAMGLQAQAEIQLNVTVTAPQIVDKAAGKTSQTVSARSSSGDIGSGTTGSDVGRFNLTSPNVDVTTSFALHDDTSADCADLSLLFNRGLAIPGACVEYKYDFNNADETNGLEDIAFASTMNPNFRFMAAEVSGFSDGSLQLPAPNADCAVTSCKVAFNAASLPPSSMGMLRVRVKLK